MPKIFPIIKRVEEVAAGGDTPDITWVESVDFSDNPAVAAVLLDDVALADDLNTVTLSTPMSDDLALSDDKNIEVSGTDQPADDLDYSDTFSRGFIQDLIVNRSGTPDADQSGDGWVDRANATTAHGNENLTVRAATVPGVSNDEWHAYIKWDLQAARIAGVARRTGGTHNIKLRVSHPAAVAKNLSLQVLHNAAVSPFTESTLTWNTTPAGTSVIAAADFSIPAGAASDVTITISDANLDTLLGKWVYVRAIPGTLAVVADVFTIISRDTPSLTTSPRLTLDLDL